MNHQNKNCAQVHLTHPFPSNSSINTPAFQKKIWRLASCLFVAAVLVGCASTKVSNRERLVYDKLPRPAHIVVYDFVASPTEVPSDSMFASQANAPVSQPTEEEMAIGRELGTTISAKLVDEIREMGLPAEIGAPDTKLQVNDIVIRGYLVSIEQGSAAKRMTIGFGSGGSELTTAIEGFQMTSQGLRKIGGGTMEAKGSKGPGAGVGAAGWLITGSPVGLIASGGMKVYGEASGSSKVEGRAKQTAKEIADQLEVRFKEEGWIN